MISYLQHIPLWELVLLGAFLVLFLYQVYFLFRYMWLRSQASEVQQESVVASTPRSNKPHLIQLDLFAPTVKGVSVIVSARNEALNLKPFLQALLEQDYPLFEVIVVNDGSEDDTQDVLDAYMVKYRRLKLTFVPKGARVISSKKLALTLAVKAARYDYLLFTDADCRPESKYWVRDMVRGFEANEQTEIVLGYGAYFATKGHVSRLTQYETLTTGLQYMGFARAGRPYMGVGRNLAYRKELFVRNNGFASFAGEKAGDDDLFVNHTATSANTIVVSTPESITWSLPKSSFSAWYQQRKRHLSVSPLYTPKTKFLLALEPICRGLFYALLLVLMVVAAWPVKVAIGGIYLLRLLLQYGVFARGARLLRGERVPMVSIAWFDITLPILTLFLLSSPRKRNQYW